MADDSARSIRVRVLDKEYPLRVAPADEAYTRGTPSRAHQRQISCETSPYRVDPTMLQM